MRKVGVEIVSVGFFLVDVLDRNLGHFRVVDSSSDVG